MKVAVDASFETNIDYAMLVKVYGSDTEGQKRYSPATCLGCETMVALHVMHYNFCRIHQTLRVAPAMAAGISDRLWEVEDLIALLD